MTTEAMVAALQADKAWLRAEVAAAQETIGASDSAAGAGQGHGGAAGGGGLSTLRTHGLPILAALTQACSGHPLVPCLASSRFTLWRLSTWVRAPL